MNKSAFELIILLLFVYFSIIYCDTSFRYNKDALQKGIQNHTSSTTELMEESRLRRRHHHLWKVWGWHALAIAFWIKVKVVIVSFFVGSAVYFGLRHWWPQKSCGHSAPIIYDSPPISFHHDHIPYSLDHEHSPYSVDTYAHYDHSVESDPYAGYSTSYDADAIAYGSDSFTAYDDKHHSIKKRENRQQEQKPQVLFEDRLGEMIFMFLGLDSRACRRRFICEMEFRSRLNPITSMGFRIVGRGFFEKYTNKHNEVRQATSFEDCASVNSECVFIEKNDNDDDNDNDEQQETTEHSNIENDIPLSNTDMQKHNEVYRKQQKHKYSQIGWADS